MHLCQIAELSHKADGQNRKDTCCGCRLSTPLLVVCGLVGRKPARTGTKQHRQPADRSDVCPLVASPHSFQVLWGTHHRRSRPGSQNRLRTSQRCGVSYPTTIVTFEIGNRKVSKRLEISILFFSCHAVWHVNS